MAPSTTRAMQALDLNDVALFVRVVERGGFARAAREIGAPTSTVSRAIGRLEATVGARLLVRSTRSVAPTAEGVAFFQGVSPAIAALHHAARVVDGADRTVRGRLRVTAPNDVGATFLADVVTRYTRRYPRVEVELLLTPRTVDLAAEGVDVALRAAARLPDSSLIARRLGPIEAALYASSDYIETRGAPVSLDDLGEHATVLFRPRDGRAVWTLTDGEREVSHTVRGAIQSDDFLFVRGAVLAGAGIGLLPRIAAAADLAEGRLVHVLPRWRSAGASLFFVHPPMRTVPARIEAFRELVVESFDRRLGASAQEAARAPRPSPRRTG